MTRSFFNTEFFFIVMSHYSTRIGITEGKKGVEASEGSGEDVVMMQKGNEPSWVGKPLDDDDCFQKC